MKTNIEISDTNRQEVATLLNRLLSNEYVLYTKTRGAHWNIEGPNFIGLHQFFQTQYEILNDIVDNTAERIRALGHYPLGLLKDFLAITDMLEDSGDFGNERRILQSLKNDQETIIRVIRNDIAPIVEKYRDLGTADFVTGIMEQHEKMAWMLRAHLAE